VHSDDARDAAPPLDATDGTTGDDAADGATTVDTADANDDTNAPDAPDGSDAETDGTGDGSVEHGPPPPPPPGMCNASAVIACDDDGSGSGCGATYCGGRLWRDGHGAATQYVPYRIVDPAGRFSAVYAKAIQDGAEAWSKGTSGLVQFEPCTRCTGRFISVVPGDGDGITNPEDLEQFLPMPVDESGSLPSPHRIAHQWGHVLGLAHTYQRADRDRYLRFDPAVWCGAGRAGLPPRCAFTPQDRLGGLAIPSDTFGVFDEKSKMNAFEMQGVCGAAQPDASSGAPTIGDVSAVEELFFSVAWGWAPFRPIGRSVSQTKPLDYQVADGVDPVGTPAIAEWDPSPEIFVRGDDDGIYTTRLDPSQSRMFGWTDWEKVADDVGSDPAAVFADATTVYLAFRSQGDQQIDLRRRADGAWGPAMSIGAPSAGAASAPAIAAHGDDSLDVAVIGGDGLLYLLECADAHQLCAGSATGTGAWHALKAPPPGTFVGAPSIVWLANNQALMVAAVGLDRGAWVVGYRPNDAGDWTAVGPLDLGPGDPNPGVAIEAQGDFNTMGFFARGRSGRLVNANLYAAFPLGGVLASVPSAVGGARGPLRFDVAALIEDHHRPGVWWRFDDLAYRAPCNYNDPGTCAQCGCNLPGAPACDL
jgi:hypothetical protein